MQKNTIDATEDWWNSKLQKDVFIKLCNKLEAKYGFKGSRRMCALEILGMFLFTLGHGAGKRLTQERFQHSDGVHVNVVIPPEDQVPFVGRKGVPTQNVMAICNFDMQVVYAYVGWECSAHDTRIFYSALRSLTSNFPKPPQGCHLNTFINY
ncbi:hypothetical protein CsatB_028280 [Cannabis sativa]